MAPTNRASRELSPRHGSEWYGMIAAGIYSCTDYNCAPLSISGAFRPDLASVSMRKIIFWSLLGRVAVVGEHPSTGNIQGVRLNRPS
jgi:hypothetical protein